MKKKSGQTNFGSKMKLGPRRFWVERFLESKKSEDRNDLSKKNLQSKNYLCPNIILVPQACEFKKQVLCQETFGSTKRFGKTICLGTW